MSVRSLVWYLHTYDHDSLSSPEASVKDRRKHSSKTDNETVSDGSGPTGHASFVNTIHTFGKPEASSIECLDTTQQQPVRVVPRVNKVQNSSKGDQKGTSGTTKPLSDKPPRISSIIQDRDTQLFLELESALSP
ncbi:hypothetical protein DFH28DRAFT_1140798 [Melampsora americana]|nr:hypothetical protein DFH28DRAFT_1140798 [Melampsora americana]